MTEPRNLIRYRHRQLCCHWLTFILVVAAYLLIENRGLFERGSDARAIIKNAHYLCGLLILLLTILRLWWRWSLPSPAIAPPLSVLQKSARRLGHGLIYGFLLFMPLLGIVLVSAEGDRISLGIGVLPPVIGPDKALAHDVEEWHETLGSIGYWLLGLHALIAIAHHYWRRDNTLKRMLPNGLR